MYSYVSKLILKFLTKETLHRLQAPVLKMSKGVLGETLGVSNLSKTN
jgi:uncharacterized membrane protein